MTQQVRGNLAVEDRGRLLVAGGMVHRTYLADTESSGELPPYRDGVYERTLASGAVPALDSADAGEKRK